MTDTDTLTPDDVYALIGQAEIQRAEGRIDMPLYYYDLARRIALTLGDAAMAQQCERLKARERL